jgi:hypothetical protein
MALETRRGRLYYYQKLRIGRRVVSVYAGGGELGALCADLQALETDRLNERRRQRHQEHAAIAADDPALLALECALATLTRAVLVANGYHQHKRQWRRYRAQTQSSRPADGDQ